MARARPTSCASNAAVEVLTAAYSAGPPADPLDTIWRAFSHLDRKHRLLLHQKLTELAAQPLAPAAE